ncbi:hypothetical protein SELMODRAFT_426367 [Selaginella moellendorffii]|uniref:Uncharacterized protein n=1 Tax=Selaginella moellendorffii TaxID=88036 RepID=D8SW56_SELML|nr:hypothetical protein SELMODRAFT_426367 [Selaginella moellendorffii]
MDSGFSLNITSSKLAHSLGLQVSGSTIMVLKTFGNHSDLLAMVKQTLSCSLISSDKPQTRAISSEMDYAWQLHSDGLPANLLDPSSQSTFLRPSMSHMVVISSGHSNVHVPLSTTFDRHSHGFKAPLAGRNNLLKAILKVSSLWILTGMKSLDLAIGMLLVFVVLELDPSHIASGPVTFPYEFRRRAVEQAKHCPSGRKPI